MTRRLTDEQRDLAGRWWPLAASIAIRWARCYPGEHDVIFDIVAVAACRAAMGYESARSGDYRGYLSAILNFALRDWARIRRRSHARRRPRAVRARHELYADDREPWGRRAVVPGDLATDPPPHARVDDADEADRLLSFVPQRDRAILRMHHGCGMTLAEVSASVGLCRSRVERICHHALAEIRSALAC